MVYLQINIVGIKRLGNMETCTVEDLDVALNGCVRSTFIVCKEAIPELIKTKGAIVNMSSVSGIRAVCISFHLPNSLSYSLMHYQIHKFCIINVVK